MNKIVKGVLVGIGLVTLSAVSCSIGATSIEETAAPEPAPTVTETVVEKADTDALDDKIAEQAERIDELKTKNKALRQSLELQQQNAEDAAAAAGTAILMTCGALEMGNFTDADLATVQEVYDVVCVPFAEALFGEDAI